MKSAVRMLILLTIDAMLINLAAITAIYIRFSDSIQISYYFHSYLKIAPGVTIVLLAVFYAFKMYQRAWAYASLNEIIVILSSVSLGCLGLVTISFFTFSPVPRSLAVLFWAFNVILIGGSRLAWRINIQYKKLYVIKPGRRALIIGAGDAGVMVARELKGHNGSFLPVGFIDDDPEKQKLSVLSLPVLGTRKQMPDIVDRYNIDLMIIAMPSVDAAVIRETVDICRSARATLRILPGMYQIIEGNVSINNLRPVQLEDLLRREPVHVDLQEITGYIRGETILVTGAGGSIGSELCRQAASFNPGKLVILGHGENSIHEIWIELEEKFSHIPVAIEIADIRDESKINSIFQKHRPGVVFHAAAHKHVPLMEIHPDEAVKTNIFGTRNVARAADRVGTKVFVMISTDKAVNPSSVMGATKRVAELIVRQANLTSDTIYTAVRFGNVLGSNGSVVPLFQRQIAAGGPVTVTHPEMKRYFMTIPEAVQLVIQAGAIAQGGEVFVLDMGEPVKIVDLARDMIKLSGFEPEKDIAIKFTGIRKGEKLFENLLTSEEGSSATRHKRIFVAKPSLVEVSVLEKELVNLRRKDVQCSAEDVFAVLYAVVPSFIKHKREQAR